MQLHVFSIRSSSLEYMQGARIEPNEHITLTPAAEFIVVSCSSVTPCLSFLRNAGDDF